MHWRTVLGAISLRTPSLHMVPSMRSPALEELVQYPAQMAMQRLDLIITKRGARSPWINTGPPQHLVGQKIANTGNSRLVE